MQSLTNAKLRFAMLRNAKPRNAKLGNAKPIIVKAKT